MEQMNPNSNSFFDQLSSLQIATLVLIRRRNLSEHTNISDPLYDNRSSINAPLKTLNFMLLRFAGMQAKSFVDQDATSSGQAFKASQLSAADAAEKQAAKDVCYAVEWLVESCAGAARAEGHSFEAEALQPVLSILQTGVVSLLVHDASRNAYTLKAYERAKRNLKRKQMAKAQPRTHKRRGQRRQNCRLATKGFRSMKKQSCDWEIQICMNHTNNPHNICV
eukprot:scaffold35335_cov17-Tisochrysis_lutea.AAC.1